jgi:hypothetical protein
MMRTVLKFIWISLNYNFWTWASNSCHKHMNYLEKRRKARKEQQP